MLRDPLRILSERDVQELTASSERPAATEGSGGAFLTSAWVFASHDHFPPSYAAAIAAALIGFAVFALSQSRGRFVHRLVHAVPMLVLSFVALATFDSLLAAWEARSPLFTLFSAASAPVLSLLGYSAESVHGLLHVRHPEGLISIAPSMEKVGVRWIVDQWLLWGVLIVARQRCRVFERLALGAVALAMVALVRYLLLLLVYLEHDNILLPGRGQDALNFLSVHWLIVPFLIVGGWLSGVAVRGLSGDATVTAEQALVPLRTTLPASGVLAALAFAAGLAGSFEPPDKEKAGRILIDDRFCGIWEPAARLLDTNWYGDFSTYSFNSLAEWLGHWFVVDVNTSLSYDDTSLSRYDVLVVKTPVEPIPEPERGAIERFVRRGGGLLLVGDHTNLLGMGSHLNSLCAKHGIRFRYDSISSGYAGGFTKYTPPFLGRHVAALHVDNLEFMTSCSLALETHAEAVVVAGDCRRDPHDYSSSSFFGRQGPHPELEYGRAVLAAVVQVGEGRIAAFTDSTVWSSFAVFRHDREKLAMDIIAFLNREPSPFKYPLRVSAATCALAALPFALKLIRAGVGFRVLLTGLLGVWVGVATSGWLHRKTYRVPSPHEPISEVTFLWQGGFCAFPPILGSLGSLPADRAYDTLFVSVQRLGLVPRLANTYAELLTADTRAVVVIAPVDHPPSHVLATVKSFVRQGGNLILLDDSRFDERGSAADFLTAFDVRLTYHNPEGHVPGGRHVHLTGGMSVLQAPASDAFVAHTTYGEGHVVYMRDAPDFSRKGIGHCFARPWQAARARYETVFFLLRDVMAIAPAERRYYRIL